MNFYYPLKPTRISIDSDLFKKCNLDPNFILQIKKNGWRVQIHKDGDKVEFYTRHNKRLESIADNADWKLLKDLVLNNIKANSTIIDGEFLHRRGLIKNTLYIWDLFLLNNEQLKLPYKERKNILDSIIVSHNNLYVAQDYRDNFKQVWDNIDLDTIEENEGIVIKDTREPLFISYNEPKNQKSARQFKILLEDKRNYV